jgi:nicotinate-nucleotide--dimethylbenzimidazole phosphoribosyltransferase
VIKPEPAVAKPEPVKPDPVKPVPVAANPEPVKPEPVVAPEPAKPEPAKPEPVVAPEPAKPEPVVAPEPAKPALAPTKPAPVRVEAPSGGDVKAYLRGPRNVRKGEALFEIVRVTGDPARAKELTAKVTDLEKLAEQDPIYEAFLADARKDLAGARKVSSTVVKAPRAGRAEPRVKQGASVRAGQLLAEIK